MSDRKDRVGDTITEEQVQAIRKERWEPRGLSGRADWENIDDLPLTESQKACVLEWLAQSLARTEVAKELDIWTEGKSYDPLDIEVETKTACSYVMDMGDGGRHHEYEAMSEIEEYIFKEFFDQIQSEIHTDNYYERNEKARKIINEMTEKIRNENTDNPDNYCDVCMGKLSEGDHTVCKEMQSFSDSGNIDPEKDPRYG